MNGKSICGSSPYLQVWTEDPLIQIGVDSSDNDSEPNGGGAMYTCPFRLNINVDNVQLWTRYGMS